MALPPQAIEHLSRSPVGTPGWSGKLLMFAATVFIGSIFAYLGLRFGYTPYLANREDTLRLDLETMEQQVTVADRSKLIGFYSQLANLQDLLDNHVFATNVLDFLETNVHAKVYFTRFEMNGETGKVFLVGIADSVADVSEQVRIFETSGELTAATFNNVSAIQNGKWQFDAEINFTQEFLHGSQPPRPAGETALPNEVMEKFKQLADSHLLIARNLRTCTRLKTTFPSLTTGEDLEREIVGLVSGKCVYQEQMPENASMECKYSESERTAVAQSYEESAADVAAGNLNTDVSVSFSGTTAGGSTSDDPLQAALKSGTCVISGL